MHEKVKAFLDAKKNAEKENYKKLKQQTLIELGLFEKVYSEKNLQNSVYCHSEWDDSIGRLRYFRKDVIDVTDEEYEEILKHSKEAVVSQSNSVATALTVIAWLVFIIGFLAGIALGQQEVVKGTYYQYTDTEFSFAIAFTYWCIAFISGTMFLGFAEIIKLLHAIKNKK